MARGPRLAAGGLCAHGLAVFGRSRRTLGRRPSVGACWLLRIVATGAKFQRRARLQRRAKAEWAELSWARPNGERLGSRRCRRHPSLPLFCGTRSARREVRLTGFGAPRVGPSAVDPRPVRACEWIAVRVLLAPVRWRASETSSPWEGAIEPSAEGWPVGDRPSAGAVRVACGASGDGRRRAAVAGGRDAARCAVWRAVTCSRMLCNSGRVSLPVADWLRVWRAVACN